MNRKYLIFLIFYVFIFEIPSVTTISLTAAGSNLRFLLQPANNINQRVNAPGRSDQAPNSQPANQRPLLRPYSGQQYENDNYNYLNPESNKNNVDPKNSGALLRPMGSRNPINPKGGSDITFGQSGNTGNTVSHSGNSGQTFGIPGNIPKPIGNTKNSFGQTTAQTSTAQNTNFLGPSGIAGNNFEQNEGLATSFGQNNKPVNNVALNANKFVDPDNFGKPVIQNGNTFGQSASGNSFGQPGSGNSFVQPGSAISFGHPGSGNLFGQPEFGSSFGHPESGNSFGQPGLENSFGRPGTGSSFEIPSNKVSFGQPNPGNSFVQSSSGNSFSQTHPGNSFSQTVSKGSSQSSGTDNFIGNMDISGGNFQQTGPSVGQHSQSGSSIVHKGTSGGNLQQISTSFEQHSQSGSSNGHKGNSGGTIQQNAGSFDHISAHGSSSQNNVNQFAQTTNLGSSFVHPSNSNTLSGNNGNSGNRKNQGPGAQSPQTFSFGNSNQDSPSNTLNNRPNKLNNDHGNGNKPEQSVTSHSKPTPQIYGTFDRPSHLISIDRNPDESFSNRPKNEKPLVGKNYFGSSSSSSNKLPTGSFFTPPSSASRPAFLRPKDLPPSFSSLISPSTSTSSKSVSERGTDHNSNAHKPYNPSTPNGSSLKPYNPPNAPPLSSSVKPDTGILYTPSSNSLKPYNPNTPNNNAIKPNKSDSQNDNKSVKPSSPSTTNNNSQKPKDTSIPQRLQEKSKDDKNKDSSGYRITSSWILTIGLVLLGSI